VVRDIRTREVPDVTTGGSFGGVGVLAPMPKQALLSRVASLPDTFLGEISEPSKQRLLADASISEVPAGAVVFSAKEMADRAGVVLTGIARTCLQASDGRQLSVRYAQPGGMIGSITAPHPALSVQAVTDCTILEIDRASIRAVVASDGEVGLALIREFSRRLDDVFATLATNTFGTMRERVARQLLDMATDAPHTDRLIAPVTQQGLADGVGTVREVVARILRDFREESLVATRPGHIELLDPDGIASIVGRSRAG
jgi:CRP/FNR family transcriptional regulator, cyclic AMP receptor protein